MKIKILFPVIILGLLAGCATRRQVQELSLEVKAVRTDLESLKRQNARLDSLFKSNVDQSRKLNADFAAYVKQLDERMQMVEARLGDAITLINRASGAIESRSINTPRTSNSDSTAMDTSKVQPQMDCQKVYNTAYYDFVKENFDLAQSGFENYMKECPGTALADNAQFWIGECGYLQKNYAQAQKAYEKLLNDYPQSEKLAAAKLKLGKSLYNQRFQTRAKTYFLDIIEKHPGTEEAYEASQMLERYR